jgi:hypothetical protein
VKYICMCWVHKSHISLAVEKMGVSCQYEMWYEGNLFLFIYLFNCCAGLGYIVAFTKVLKIYQIYHTWIHSIHHSPLTSPHSWNSFNRYHFSICIHSIWTIFTLLLHLLPLVPHPVAGRTCSVLLFSDFVKEKNDIFVCIR